MANDLATGYIVKARDGRFLSRNIKWALKRKFRGFPRPWVHGLETLLKGGEWTTDAEWVYPAQYNPAEQGNEITGEPVSYETFLQQHSDT